jgi:ATP-binding cassette subfamily C protein CydCD
VALGWGAYRVRAGEMDFAALVIVLMLGVEVFRPLRELRTLLHQGMLGISAAQGVFRILDAEPLVSDRPGATAADAPRLEPTVTFEAVRF